MAKKGSKFVSDDDDIVIISDGVEKFNSNHDMHGRFTSGGGSYTVNRHAADYATSVAVQHHSPELHRRAAELHARAGSMVSGEDADYHRRHLLAHTKHASALEQGVHVGRFSVQKDAPCVGDVHVPNAGGKTKKKRRPGAIIAGEEDMKKVLMFNDLLKGAADQLGSDPSKSGKKRVLIDDDETGFDAEDDITGDEHDLEPDEDEDDNLDKPDVKKSYAYTPEGAEPKLDISDARHVGMAAAALSSGGFRGNRVQIPSDALPGVKAKVRAAWRKFNPDKSDDEMPESLKKVDDVELGLEFQILKVDEEQRVVYGFASVAKFGGMEITDLQDDVIDMAEITKAAHDFMLNSRSGGNMHRQMNTGVIVESLVLDNVMKSQLGITRPEEGWLIGYKVTDEDTWQDAKAGRFKGFSIGGTGVRTPVD